MMSAFTNSNSNNKEAGGHCQAAISYTTSEIHTIDYFVKLAKELSQTGADSICIMTWQAF